MALLNSGEAIALEIKRRLQTLTVVQGAETDIGTQVFLGRRAMDRTLMPCCVIVEGEDTPARNNSRTSYHLSQRYSLLAYLACDPADPNLAAHKAIRDLKRAIFRTAGAADHRWGGLVQEVEYLGRDIGPRADGEAFVLVVVDIGVQYVEDVASP